MSNEIFKELVKTLNPDFLDDPDFAETPERIKKMYEWFFRNEDPIKHLDKKFPTNNDQMVIIKDIRAYSLCPHHLMPIEYIISIGYIPDKTALGLSKFSRIVRAVTSYPKLQENMTTQVAGVIEQLNPKGVMVVAKGMHGCMRFRGVKEKDSIMITSDCRGIFRVDQKTREEFLTLIKN